MTPAFTDARKRKGAGGNSRPFDPAKHPRGPGGRFAPIGERIKATASQAGQNTANHVAFASVRRPAELSKLVGEDVRGFKHAASNQSLGHVLKEHGNAKAEQARGQKAIEVDDFAKLPAIVKTGTYHDVKQRPFGPRRVEIIARIDGDEYHYIGEIRRKKRRIDLVTMWKR